MHDDAGRFLPNFREQNAVTNLSIQCLRRRIMLHAKYTKCTL
jgi:hypothetical protein